MDYVRRAIRGSTKIKRIYEYGGLYYVLFKNWKVHIYRLCENTAIRIIKLKGIFGEKLIFYQNIMLGVGTDSYDSGLLTYCRLLYCQEIKNTKAQCKNFTEEIYDTTLYDAIIDQETSIPILLLEGEDRQLLLLKRNYLHTDTVVAMV